MNVNMPIALLIGLAGCASTATGTYAGRMAIEQGVCGPSEAIASLNLRGKTVQFAPNNGVVLLDGHVDADGHVLAQSQTMGADHKPFAQVFEGQLANGQITGRYATPRCRATVTLVRR